MGGIKLQLLCGVRIELAVGSLPYLARYPSRSLPIPSGGAGWSWVGCGCHKVPIYRPNSDSAEFRACGIKLQHVVLG